MKSPRIRTIRGQNLDFTPRSSPSPVTASLTKVEAPFGSVNVMNAGSPTRVSAFNRTPKSLQNDRLVLGPKVRTSPSSPLSKNSISSPSAIRALGTRMVRNPPMLHSFSKSQRLQNYQDYLRKKREEHGIDNSIL